MRGGAAGLRACIGALLLVLAACGSGGEPPAEGDWTLAGCYRFVEPDEVPPLGLPWGIELTDDPLEGWPALEGAFLARTWLTDAQAADHPFGYWRPVDGDSIRTGYPVGGGFDLVLARLEGTDDLAGRGRAVGDVVLPGDPGGPAPEGAVMARRVACPST